MDQLIFNKRDCAQFKNMWSQSFVFVPCSSGWDNALEAQRHFETRLATGMLPWCFIPTRPYLLPPRKEVPVKSLSNEESKKILLNRSVLDLVKNTQSLELTDPKLLGWYLSLPVKDRKLIQEEGGLLHFLQNHPALAVTRRFVYVQRNSLEECVNPLSPAMSSDLNKSRRPTYYTVSLCKNCGASVPSNTKVCRLCCVPTKKPKEKFCLSEDGRELGFLPSSAKEELNFCTSDVMGAPGQRRSADQPLNFVTEESFQSACDCSNAAEATPGQQGVQCSQAHILGQLWDEEVQNKSGVVTVYKEPSAQASFALDVQLERHGKTPQGVVGSQERGGYRGEETADYPDLETETLPEYCSFDSTGLGTCSDTSQSVGFYSSESDPAAEPRAMEDIPREADSCSSVDFAPCHGKYAEWMPGDHLDDFGMEEDSRYGLKNEEFHSMMEEEPLEMGGAAWVSSWTPTQQGLEMDPRLNPGPAVADQSGGLQGEGAGTPHSPRVRGVTWSCREHDFVRSPPGDSSSASHAAKGPQVTVSQSVDVSGDFRASYTSTQATEAGWSVACRSSNTDPPRATKNAAVNTDCSRPDKDQGTQTTSAPTAEKYGITEVSLADLDYFTEEFIKLQHAQDELKELKAKLACSEGEVQNDDSRDHECDCSQRAVRAELRLLALQRAMCQQHCWRRYYTSPEGDCSILSMEAPSENIKNVLQDLEEDYCEMKSKIVSGVPLDQLLPLTVNSQRLGSEALYVPSQIIKDSLSEEEVSEPEQRGPHNPVHPDRGEGERGGPVECRSSESVQTDQSDGTPAVKTGSAKSVRPGTPLPQRSGPTIGPAAESAAEPAIRTSAETTARPAIGPTSLPTVGHKPGGAKDAELSEAWFDAEEEIGPVSKSAKGNQQGGGVDEGTISKGKKDVNCFLCVTDLPSDATEDEVRSCFRKYQVSEVNITTFSNNFRVAMMTSGCPKLAEAAVREVNGRTIRGHVVKVTSVRRPLNASTGQSGGKATPISRSFPRVGRAVNTPGPRTSKSVLSIATKVGPEPLQHRLEKLMNVQDTPTASGTCVPQHYATMGSFDTLMARLSERHPEAGREKIVQALVELREQKRGLLSGLPLKTIVEMTSDLLTRPSTSTVV
ncbi:hypothetical protein SKAU_G00243090 [Synaphobranchus kaupii]|uniref:RRM domain-containing protein n=1 Tax=Synaphobranchus kaupii TaxID=118154 RepID=A0A9Q1F827_SYNKA|nr:hypothetical protein SKAU_G00243090 [Synaphobranchus kaupii]